MARNIEYLSMLSLILFPLHSYAKPGHAEFIGANIEFRSFDEGRFSNHNFAPERLGNSNDKALVPTQLPNTQAPTCVDTDANSVSELVRSIAKAEGFDEDLAEAVAWAESDLGRNQGPSSAGALGIMQLMAGTAADLGVSDRCNAEQNIRGGIQYLKQLHGKFNDPLLMLAAYNAGAGNVHKANGIPANTETSKYIVKILNRWKLSKTMSSPPVGARALPDNLSDSIASPPKKASWKDGHVFDFGE